MKLGFKAWLRSASRLGFGKIMLCICSSLGLLPPKRISRYDSINERCIRSSPALRLAHVLWSTTVAKELQIEHFRCSDAYARVVVGVGGWRTPTQRAPREQSTHTRDSAPVVGERWVSDASGCHTV